MRQLFVFWEFNGDNSSYCNQTCPYCYGGKKEMKHYWNGDVEGWERAFERLGRDIYFVFSYGECMGSHGFYDCVDMIGRHPNWTLCIISNFSFNPRRLLASRLATEKRLFVTACWHPLGVSNRLRGWEKFKKHLLMVKDAEVPLHVLMVWYRPQIKWFPEHFEWYDQHDIRIGVRRFVEKTGGLKLPFHHRRFFGKYKLSDYSDAERGFIYAATCPKVTEYGLNLASPKGRFCSAGKDMILVKYNGDVSLCADCYGYKYGLGNVFDVNFRLSDNMIRCPVDLCGGDYGMLHLVDERFGSLPNRLWNDTFYSQVENVIQGSPVQYHRHDEMLMWLEKLKVENKCGK